MCKKETIIHVDSRHRNQTSTNSSNMTIDLDFPLQLYDTDSIQVKSLHIPNTLETVNANVNDKLYCFLDLIHGLVGTWTLSGTSLTVTQGADNRHYQYTDSGATRYMYLSAWDGSASTATIIWSHDLAGTSNAETLNWDGANFENTARTFTITPPAGWTFAGTSSEVTDQIITLARGTYDASSLATFKTDLQNKLDTAFTAGRITVSLSTATLTIETAASTFSLYIYSDQVMQTTSFSPTFDKKNLKSANEFINNTGNSKTAITNTAKYVTNITDFQPIKALVPCVGHSNFKHFG